MTFFLKILTLLCCCKGINLVTNRAEKFKKYKNLKSGPIYKLFAKIWQKSEEKNPCNFSTSTIFFYNQTPAATEVLTSDSCSVTLQKILWKAALEVTRGITAPWTFRKSAPNLQNKKSSIFILIYFHSNKTILRHRVTVSIKKWKKCATKNCFWHYVCRVSYSYMKGTGIFFLKFLNITLIFARCMY